MPKTRFTEQQIIAVLKSVEAGCTVKDVCREAVLSEASYDNWKEKYGGMEAADIKKMKDPEDENRRLRQMFAHLSLENRALKAVIEKRFKISDKALTRRLPERGISMSIRQACRTLSLSRTVCFYQPDTRRDELMIQTLSEMAERDTGLRSFFRFCAGKRGYRTTSVYTGFTAC